MHPYAFLPTGDFNPRHKIWHKPPELQLWVSCTVMVTAHQHPTTSSTKAMNQEETLHETKPFSPVTSGIFDSSTLSASSGERKASHPNSTSGEGSENKLDGRKRKRKRKHLPNPILHELSSLSSEHTSSSEKHDDNDDIPQTLHLAGYNVGAPKPPHLTSIPDRASIPTTDRNLLNNDTTETKLVHPSIRQENGSPDSTAQQWMNRYQELAAYHKNHGHCNVPVRKDSGSSDTLAQWVKRQRYQYQCKQKGKKSQLSAEREALLGKLGFVWDRHDAAWEENFLLLFLFWREHSHCHVPKQLQQLSSWAKRQRRLYKLWQANRPSTLSAERVRRLNELGFVWNATGTEKEHEEAERTDAN